MEPKVYSISQLNNYIKGIFDAEELLRNISICGEISGLGVSGKNAYFVLKEEGAQINCIFFNCHDFNGFYDGDTVVVSGMPVYYVKGGKLSFNVSRIRHAGQGDLYRQFLELKDRLQKEGLFDRKIEKPKKIKRIGVVTSPTGAVIQDIINIATRRDPSIEIIVCPVKVQGIGSETEIVNAVNMLDSYKKIDVIIVARGGGSLEDLAAFNTETVARAVANCQKYIVSAVGHETDFTLCDFASDLRAPTPSAAAELLTVDTTQRVGAVYDKINTIKKLVNALYSDAVNDMRYLCVKLSGIAKIKVLQAETALKNNCRNMQSFVDALYLSKKIRFDKAINALEYLSPSKLLKQGYTKVISAGGVETDSVQKIELGENIKVVFSDGSVKANVVEITSAEVKI